VQVERQRDDHHRERAAEREQTARTVPGDRLAQEQHGEHRDHDADEVPLQVVEIPDQQPAGQRQPVVDEQRVEPEAEDVQRDGDQEHVDRLDHADREELRGLGRHGADAPAVRERRADHRRLVEDRRRGAGEGPGDRDERELAAGGEDLEQHVAGPSGVRRDRPPPAVRRSGR
jgi:hypothetical protein